MMTKLSYIYAKILKKMRGCAVVDSKVDATSVIYSGAEVVHSSVGRYTYVGYNCVLNNVDIGSYCSLAEQIYIGGEEHPMEWASTSPVFQNVRHSGPRKRFARFPAPEYRKTVIGSDVWIGHGAIIKMGVKVGDGAVIGGGAVVTKDIPPFAVVGGVPAKVIRYRFEPGVIERLLRCRWWNLADEELQKAAPFVRDVGKFLEVVESKANMSNKG